MRILAREYKWYKDFWFQCNVLFDKSLQNIMFDNTLKTLEYFLPFRFCAKYVVIRECNGKKEKVGFAAFLKDRRKKVCWIVGFVPTNEQNKGIGIYGGVACINELFNKFPDYTIFSSSHAYNKRAVRATKSFGFHMVSVGEHFEGSLTKKQFDNVFVKDIKKRCNIES